MCTYLDQNQVNVEWLQCGPGEGSQEKEVQKRRDEGAYQLVTGGVKTRQEKKFCHHEVNADVGPNDVSPAPSDFLEAEQHQRRDGEAGHGNGASDEGNPFRDLFDCLLHHEMRYQCFNCMTYLYCL